MIKKGVYVCLILFSTVFVFSQSAKHEWHLKKNEKGIEIYTRKTVVSDFKELKSIMYLKTSLQSLVALINDWESYPEWVYKCGKSVTLKRINDTSVMHYQTVLVPWPAEKRDFVVNIVLTQNKGNKIVTIKSINAPNFIPHIKDHIRITYLEASWTLVPMFDGSIQVNYELLVDPGGSIPAWLVNMAAVNGPYETMVNFKERVIKKKYQEAKISYIKELK